MEMRPHPLEERSRRTPLLFGSLLSARKSSDEAGVDTRRKDGGLCSEEEKGEVVVGLYLRGWMDGCVYQCTVCVDVE